MRQRYTQGVANIVIGMPSLPRVRVDLSNPTPCISPRRQRCPSFVDIIVQVAIANPLVTPKKQRNRRVNAKASKHSLRFQHTNVWLHGAVSGTIRDKKKRQSIWRRARNQRPEQHLVVRVRQDENC